MNKSYLTEADREEMARLQAVEERHRARVQLRVVDSAFTSDLSKGKSTETTQEWSFPHSWQDLEVRWAVNKGSNGDAVACKHCSGLFH